MSPTYDPDAIRDVGKWTVPTLATSYERFEQQTVHAGAELDSGGISQALSSTFTDYHLLLRNAIAETRENYEGLGLTLVAIADEDEVTEEEIQQGLEDLGQDVSEGWSDQGYEPMGTGSSDEDIEAAPSDYDELYDKTDKEKDE